MVPFRARVLFVLACWALGVVPARAEPVAVGFRAAILLRALGYEHSVATAQGDLVLAVVGGTDAPSATDAHAMYEVFAGLAQRMRVANRAVKVVRVQHHDVAATGLELARHKPQAVYFASGLERAAVALFAQLAKSRTVTMCADGAELADGCVLGVQSAPTSSILVVHLARAKEAQLGFDPRVLKLSRVVQ